MRHCRILCLKRGNLGLGEPNTLILEVKNSVVVLEEWDTHDPEGARTRHLHGHELESTDAFLTLNIVDRGELIWGAADHHLKSWIIGVVSVCTLADEEVVHGSVGPAIVAF